MLKKESFPCLESQLRQTKMIPHYCFFLGINSDSITIIRTPEKRAWLKQQVEVQMKRVPNISVKAMKSWLRDDASVDWSDVNRVTFHLAVARAMEKIRTTGSTKRKPGGGHEEEFKELVSDLARASGSMGKLTRT